MANESKGGGSGIGTTGIFWIALLGAGALILRTAPWEGARPSAAEVKPYEAASLQDVDARLWQDPFTSIALARKVAGSAGKDSASSRHRPEALASELKALQKSAPGKILILGVMVSGNAYAEQVEFRRRARYAILAGLNESGFVPKDAEHLGFVEPEKRDHAGSNGLPLSHPLILSFSTSEIRSPSPPTTCAPPGHKQSRTVQGSAVMRVPAHFECRNVTRRGTAEVPALEAHPNEGIGQGLPDFVPYEWLSRKTQAPAQKPDKNAGLNSVLLLWLDEDIFGDRNVFKKLEAVRVQIGAAPKGDLVSGAVDGSPPMAILGPMLTDSLRDMLQDRGSNYKGVTFYATATADDVEILSSLNGTVKSNTVSDAFKEKGVSLYRTIASDRKLATALTKELKLRRLNPQIGNGEPCPTGANENTRHVVLISEWDTLYGRSLKVVMREAFKEEAGKGEADGRSSVWLHTYSYLRGLDGQSLGRGSASSEGSIKGTEEHGSSNKLSDYGAQEKRIERPEGEGQFDYIRRLVAQLRSQDADWRLKGCGQIAAVGVLGTDVFDKLIILQALRAELPGATPFTTDLDTRFLHPKQLEWTRNTIVASSYGLTLANELQQDIPPFRDSYQTALYLSSIVAINNARQEACSPNGTNDPCISQGRIDNWLEEPRIFEIGRSEAFSYGRNPRKSGEGTNGNAACSPNSPASCTGIHGDPSKMYPEPPMWLIAGFLVVLALFVALFVVATGRWERWVAWIRNEGSSGRSPTVMSLKVGLPSLAMAFLVAVAAWLTLRWKVLADYLTEEGNGEPIGLMLGVSAWPTEVMRVTSIVLSIGFIFAGWKMLDRNLDDIAKTFMWKRQWRALLAQLEETVERWPLWKQTIQMFSFRIEGHGGSQVREATGLSGSAEIFWHRYLYQNRVVARATRVGVATVLYFVAATLVIRAFGIQPPPVRGELLGIANFWIVMASVFLMLLLIFFVVDATVFVTVLLRALRWQLPEERGELDPTGEAGSSRWPQSTLDYYASQLNVEKSLLDDWITLQFAAKRTRVVSRLVYMPFVVIAIMVLSRSAIFDRWGTPVGLVLVNTASVIIVLVCGIMLRQTAEELRRRAIRRLSEKRIALIGHSEGGSRTASQVDLMIAQIRAIDVGAFAPYSHQPIVRALLLPLSSYGGAALIEYLSIAGF
jgi:hypothetical protein